MEWLASAVSAVLSFTKQHPIVGVAVGAVGTAAVGATVQGQIPHPTNASELGVYLSVTIATMLGGVLIALVNSQVKANNRSTQDRSEMVKAMSKMSSSQVSIDQSLQTMAQDLGRTASILTGLHTEQASLREEQEYNRSRVAEVKTDVQTIRDLVINKAIRQAKKKSKLKKRAKSNA
jgi:hypothetical protein